MSKIINFFKIHLYASLVEFILLPFPNIKLTNRLRGILLKPLFKKCGKNLQIAKNVTINMHRNCIIGNDVYIAHNCWINATGGLYINDQVIISPNVIIATTKHQYIDGVVSNIHSSNAPINIGKGTWIAGNSTIILGVDIGKGVIIGAGSVVTKNLNDYTLYAGTPAKYIKDLR